MSSCRCPHCGQLLEPKAQTPSPLTSGLVGALLRLYGPRLLGSSGVRRTTAQLFEELAEANWPGVDASQAPRSVTALGIALVRLVEPLRAIGVEAASQHTPTGRAWDYWACDGGKLAQYLKELEGY